MEEVHSDQTMVLLVLPLDVLRQLVEEVEYEKGRDQEEDGQEESIVTAHHHEDVCKLVVAHFTGPCSVIIVNADGAFPLPLGVLPDRDSIVNICFL